MTQIAEGIHLYQVGKPYSEGQVSYPNNGQDFNFRSGSIELRTFLPNLSAEEIQTYQSAPIEFGLLMEGHCIFLCNRLQVEGAPWSDATFNWYFVPEEERTIPEPLGPNERPIVNHLLIDSATGILCSYRAFTFSPEFSAALFQMIRDQIGMGEIPKHDFISKVQAIYALNSCDELAGKSPYRCVSGD